MSDESNTVSQTKQWRKDLDAILQDIKLGSDTKREVTVKCIVRGSRERSLCVTKLQEAIMWLGMDLKAMREEGCREAENPYPESYNPASPAIEPTADGLKL